MTTTVCGVCTLGELEAAVAWFNADAEGDVRVIYSRNGKHEYKRFVPDGTVCGKTAVIVQWDKPGHKSRIIGKFRVLEHSKIETAELEQTDERCPVMRWVIMYRLCLSDTSE
jgi:hypothetical protein